MNDPSYLRLVTFTGSTSRTATNLDEFSGI